MEEKNALAAFAALSQETRLRIVRLLVGTVPDGLAAGQIAQALGVSASNLSFHLSHLEQAGLVTSHREARSIIYGASTEGLRGLVGFLLQDCCGGRPDLCAPSGETGDVPAEASVGRRVFNVLFLCTGNSARSIMAEAILAEQGAGRFRAFSAGSRPRASVDPLTLQTLESLGYSTAGLRAKSWDEFREDGAPQMDFVFTVCDAAAGERCPVWPGQPVTAHWGIEDPAAVEGPPIERERAFAQAAKYLRNRIAAFAALPAAGLDRAAITRRLDAIGGLEGASSGLRVVTGGKTLP